MLRAAFQLHLKSCVNRTPAGLRRIESKVPPDEGGPGSRRRAGFPEGQAGMNPGQYSVRSGLSRHASKGTFDVGMSVWLTGMSSGRVPSKYS